MSIIELLLKEMEKEAVTTRKMLKRVPAEKFDYKPHEKSMSLLQLTTHIVELPGWVSLALNTEELDFATMDYIPTRFQSADDLLAAHDQHLDQARKDLSSANEEKLKELWTLRQGDTIFSKDSKYEVIRMTFAQIIHHRAQLGVYLRLLNIPIPGSYGPSADEPGFNG